jgi:hypothetical protein
MADERNEIQDENPALSGQFHGTTQEVIARYTHCGLCGAHLHFSHVTDFTKNLTHEMSRCPECTSGGNGKAKRVIHRLQ